MILNFRMVVNCIFLFEVILEWLPVVSGRFVTEYPLYEAKEIDFVNEVNTYNSSTEASDYYQEDLDENEVGQRIVGGHECKIKDNAFFVTLQKKEREDLPYDNYCGGSILKPQWILTSASCCNFSDLTLARVVAGAARPYRKVIVDGRAEVGGTDGSDRANIASVFIHPLYDQKYFNDICLLELSNVINETKLIKYAKLKEPIHKQKVVKFCTKAVVMGFGIQAQMVHLDVMKKQENYKNRLMCANLPVLLEDQCLNYGIPPSFQPGMMICTYDKEGGADACYGDYGSPLVCNDEQIGIVTYGLGCGQKDVVRWYTRVDVYHDFIYGTQHRIVRAKEIDSVNGNGNLILNICIPTILTINMFKIFVLN